MKKIIAAALALAMVLPFSTSASAAETEAEYDGFIISLKENELLSVQSSAEDQLHALGGGFYHVEQLGDVTELIRMGAVESLEPNYKMYLQSYESEWNMAAVKAAAAWDHSDAAGSPDMRGDGVVIAVIDSGVYAEHPDFADANILDYIDLTGNDKAVDTTHGTQVAGILAAGLKNGIGVDGAVPDVSILPIRITSGGDTSNALAIEAINTAVEMGADVINISVGGKKANTALEQACADAAAAGVIIVCAAGNYTSGSKSSDNYMYPAAFESTVSVSACKQSGDGVIFDSEYSYFNSLVDVAAPGTGVKSLCIDGGTMTSKGTSFAAPHVSALAVMLKQHKPNASLEDFTVALESSCVDLGDEGRDDYYGLGFIDTEAFVMFIAEESEIPPEDDPMTPPVDDPVTPPEDDSVTSPEDDPVTPPVDDPVTPPGNAPERAPGSISAADLSAAAESGKGIVLSLELGEVQLSVAAVEQLVQSGATEVTVSLTESENGLGLSFAADGVPLSLMAPVLLNVDQKNAIPYYSADGTDVEAVAVSATVNGGLRIIIPGGGEISFRQKYSSFADLDGHWAAANAVFVANRDIFKGDGTYFMPGDLMTRAMFATVLGRIYERSYGSIEVDGGGYFTDCDYDSWYGPYVDWCYEADIVQGDGNGGFDPAGEISRAQMAAMIHRFAAVLGLSTVVEGGMEFIDCDEIPAWAEQAAAFCLENGIMGGIGEDMFAPLDKATRAQCAAVIQRLIMYALE